MNHGKTIFSQITEFAPYYEFQKCVRTYRGDHNVRTFSCWEQFLCMVFAQCTRRESLREIETCLRAYRTQLYHAGIRSKVSRSTLADANEARDWRIYRDFGKVLIARAAGLYENDPFSVVLHNVVYALDSTSIELCISLFPWSAYCKTQGAICLHTLLNLRGAIPSVVVMTDKKVSELTVLGQLDIEPGAIYIVDRGYIDYERFYAIDQQKGYFLTRAKSNFGFRRLYSNNIDKTTGVRCDQVVCMDQWSSRKRYPEKLRRIRYVDDETKKPFVFLTNHMTLSAKTIADLYRCRWQIELFFKWIKQHLCITAFYGRSENAVKTQLWIALSTYVLISIIKKQLSIDLSLYTMLQILSVSLFQKTKLSQVFSDSELQKLNPEAQLSLF